MRVFKCFMAAILLLTIATTATAAIKAAPAQGQPVTLLQRHINAPRVRQIQSRRNAATGIMKAAIRKLTLLSIEFGMQYDEQLRNVLPKLEAQRIKAQAAREKAVAAAKAKKDAEEQAKKDAEAATAAATASAELYKAGGK